MRRLLSLAEALKELARGEGLQHPSLRGRKDPVISSKCASRAEDPSIYSIKWGSATLVTLFYWVRDGKAVTALTLGKNYVKMKRCAGVSYPGRRRPARRKSKEMRIACRFREISPR